MSIYSIPVYNQIMSYLMSNDLCGVFESVYTVLVCTSYHS